MVIKNPCSSQILFSVLVVLLFFCQISLDGKTLPSTSLLLLCVFTKELMTFAMVPFTKCKILLAKKVFLFFQGI